MQTRSSTTPAPLVPRPGRPLRRSHLAVLCAAALLPLGANAAPQAPTATELMDWAQARLSSFFPGRVADVRGEGFVYRGPYSSGNYLGVSGNAVYAMGPATGGQLLALGTLQDLACVVKPASCGPSDAPALVNDFLARLAAVYAAQPSGAAIAPLMDGCYLDEGRNRAYRMTQLDTDSATRASFERVRDATRRNPEVLAERFAINPDGSDRREIDIRYEVAYADGTRDVAQETLIQGSSAGTRTPLGECSAPQVSQQLRMLGNQRVVGTSVTALSMLLDRYRLADGAPQASAARLYRNEVRFNVTDPGNVATYATISGPGIVGSAYKLISPRLLRSAPEFAGKIGNYVDWDDAESFKACRNASDNNYADATLADCTANGATSNNWRAQDTDPARVDTRFAGYGFTAGGEYTVKVYADDGWRAVNGQAAHAPIATYTTRLARLPVSAAALAAGATTERFGMVRLAQTPAELAAFMRARAGGTLQFTETAKARAGGNALPWSGVYFYSQGRTAASSGSNFYPASRHTVATSPLAGASSTTLAVSPGPAAMTQATYGELGGVWNDVGGVTVRHLLTFE